MVVQLGDRGKKLIFWGAVLFLFGLVQGLFIAQFLNPRMALSAHLAAVQSGMALMIFGFLWCILLLEERCNTIAYYSSVASMYLIWLAITLSAVVGSSKVLPIAGEGFSASWLSEKITELILYLGSGLALVSAVLIVLGLYKRFKQ